MKEYIIKRSTRDFSPSTLAAVYVHANAVRCFLGDSQPSDVAELRDTMDACRNAIQTRHHSLVALDLGLCSKETLVLISRDMMNAYVLIEEEWRDDDDRVGYYADVNQWEEDYAEVCSALDRVKQLI